MRAHLYVFESSKPQYIYGLVLCLHVAAALVLTSIHAATAQHPLVGCRQRVGEVAG